MSSYCTCFPQLSPGDSGWDVFSLDYHVDGPISTVFTSEVMLQYLRVFNFLWRAKRMEHCLANMWRNQAAYYSLVDQIPGQYACMCIYVFTSNDNFQSCYQYSIKSTC